jgi:Domain of unknown function (DUF397)
MNGKVDRVDQWRKSDLCGQSPNCVEIAVRAGGVAVRDSKNPDGPMLEFTAIEWAVFLGGVRAGQFDA